jgi:hypothetical protein
MRSMLLLVSLCVALAACTHHDPPVAPTNKPPADAPPAARSIGTASMAADGTITLQLRAEGPGGAVGDALLVYPPSHAQYHEILDHLAGLKPGQTMPVPPWP